MNKNDFDIAVRHIAYQSRWFVNASRYGLRNNVNNTDIFGTQRRSAVELIEDSLNQQLPTVRDPASIRPRPHGRQSARDGGGTGETGVDSEGVRALGLVRSQA